MGLITTVGNYCYVQCDGRNCNKKMEHVDLKLLKDLAHLCGWENSGDRWTCPGCSEQAVQRKPSKKKRSVSSRTRQVTR
jgi:hypothetical protein